MIEASGLVVPGVVTFVINGEPFVRGASRLAVVAAFPRW